MLSEVLRESSPFWRSFSGRPPGQEEVLDASWQGFGYNSHMAPVDLASLTTEERLRLMEQIWESLTTMPEAIPLTSAQREELDRRLDELDHEGPSGIPWNEVLRQIRGRAR